MTQFLKSDEILDIILKKHAFYFTYQKHLTAIKAEEASLNSLDLQMKSQLSKFEDQMKKCDRALAGNKVYYDHYVMNGYNGNKAAYEQYTKAEQDKQKHQKDKIAMLKDPKFLGSGIKQHMLKNKISKMKKEFEPLEQKHNFFQWIIDNRDYYQQICSQNLRETELSQRENESKINNTLKEKRIEILVDIQNSKEKDAKLNQQHNEKDQDLRERELALKQQQITIMQELKEKEIQIQIQNSELKQMEIEIHQQNQELQSQNQKLMGQGVALQQKTLELQEQNIMMTTQNQLILEKGQELKEKEIQIQHEIQQLKEKEVNVYQESLFQLKDKEVYIQQQNQDLKEKEINILHQSLGLKEKTQELREINQNIFQEIYNLKEEEVNVLQYNQLLKEKYIEYKEKEINIQEQNLNKKIEVKPGKVEYKRLLEQVEELQNGRDLKIGGLTKPEGDYSRTVSEFFQASGDLTKLETQDSKLDKLIAQHNSQLEKTQGQMKMADEGGMLDIVTMQSKIAQSLEGSITRLNTQRKVLQEQISDLSTKTFESGNKSVDVIKQRLSQQMSLTTMSNSNSNRGQTTYTDSSGGESSQSNIGQSYGGSANSYGALRADVVMEVQKIDLTNVQVVNF